MVKSYWHRSTLSTESKLALSSGHITQMTTQLTKLERLWKQSMPHTKGQLHRHVIAYKREINKLSEKQKGAHTNNSNQQNTCDPAHLEDLLDFSMDENFGESLQRRHTSKAHDTLSSKYMNKRKQQRNMTRKAKRVRSMNEEIYKHYYLRLTWMTKMRLPEQKPSYTERAKCRSNGIFCQRKNQSYEEKFKNLVFKLKKAWKPRDFIQRKFEFRSAFHRLCTRIVDSIRRCTSPEKDTLYWMDNLDSLYKIVRRFKRSSPTFIKKEYRGGGPRKTLKRGTKDFGKEQKHEKVGGQNYAVSTVESLSKILKVQFKQEHGLLNVFNLYQATLTSDTEKHLLKKFGLCPVPIGKRAIQLHFCRNHYVTSEQKPNGTVVVYDSVNTDIDFQMELYTQLRYTYEMLSKYPNPPKELLQYQTLQHQKDSTSCGLYAVLRAYFILSKVSYTINEDIARAYLSDVLKKATFTNFDAFSSSHIIKSYIHNQDKLKARKLGKSTSTHTETTKTPTREEEYVEIKKKRGRPSKYSPEEKKLKDKEKRLKYYHKTKVRQQQFLQATSNVKNDCENNNLVESSADSVKEKTIRIGRKSSRSDPKNRKSSETVENNKKPTGSNLNTSSKRTVSSEIENRPSKRVHLEIPNTFDSSQKQCAKKRGRPSKYSKEEKRIKEKQKRLRHYHKSKENLTNHEIQQKKDWHKEHKKRLRLNVRYREVEKINDKEWHFEKRQNDQYRENEAIKDKKWHQEKRKHTKYREKERVKNKKRHEDRRKDIIYREDERVKDKKRHEDKRKDTEYRKNEKIKNKKRHEDRRKDTEYREDERVRDKIRHEDKRKDTEYREDERVRDKIRHEDKRKDTEYRKDERATDLKRHQITRSDPLKRKEENLKAYHRKYGQNEVDTIAKFLAAIKSGPNVVCTCCLQLWFPANCRILQNIAFPNKQKVQECTTGTLDEGKEWICSTCERYLKDNRMPPISYANGVKFYEIPKELALVQMEERCIALRQPFFQIRELPSGGQKSIKGNVVNVPMDVSKTINQLPRNLNETDTIGIKFKKKVSYKKCDYYENVRPQAVIQAARYLIANSELYKVYNVKINENWEQQIVNDSDITSRILMGTRENRFQTGSDESCSNIIEIDLTASDDDSASQGHIEMTIKSEKLTTASHNGDTMNEIQHDKQNKTDTEDSSDSEDNFSEVDATETFSGNMDTILESTVIAPGSCQNVAQKSGGKPGNGTIPLVSCDPGENETESSSPSKSVFTDAEALVIAPGEGQHPISLFNDPDAEYLAFPTIYCGHRRPIDTECKTKKKPSKADIFKWECRAQDRRVATCIPDLFFKYKSLQIDAVENVVGMSVRKVKGVKQPTVGELKTPEGRDKLRNLHEGVNMFRQMRNTPPYYSSKKKCLLAMVRQGGMPSLFFTQSCADTRWPELLKVLGNLVDGKDYSNEELEKMSYIDRNRLVAADPVTVVRYFENKCHQFQKHIMNFRGSFRQFYRREFQHRGSPHSHEIHWISNAPIYDPDNPENDQNVIDFIDNWIDTKIEVTEEEEKYLSYQLHKHSTSCRKRGEAICRFGIPFFPMAGTIILKPLQDGEADEETIETLKNSYHTLRTTLNEMGQGLDISHEQFLENIGMSESEYLLTIRSSLKTPKVFYKRKPNALRINPYMKGMLAVIKANHDVQYPLDIYALVCYVADYLLKSQKGLSATLEQACMDVLNGDMRLKQQIRHIGYKLLSTIETSAPEACYYIMQIPFTYCSVEVTLIPTSPPEERTYVLKSEAELNELPEGSRDVLKSNKITLYAKRPRKLEFLCLADYVSELTIQYDRNNSKTEELIQSESDTINSHDYDEYDEDVIPESTENQTVEEDIFPLKVKGMTYKKRRNARVIRFVNYNRTYDPENYCREKLLLYMPWRKEELLKGKHESYEEAFKANENVIRNNMKKYEKFAEEVREAEELIETTNNDGNFDEIAPNIEHVELDDEDIGPTDSTEYRFFRPPTTGERETSADILYNAGIVGATDTSIETMAGFMSEDKYLAMVRSLNEKQFQIYTHILHHTSQNNSKPLHLFITGGAGVGKSMVLRCVYQGLLRLLAKKEGQNPEAPRIIIAAPTGKAAYLVEGNTIHSILKILPSRGNDYIPLSDENRESLRIKFKNLNTVIIDEISMVGKRMLTFIHQRLQEIMGCYDKLFGGLNVIFFGDLFQLRPVMDGWIFEDLELPDPDEPPKKQKDDKTKKKKKRKRKLRSAAALAPNLWKDNFKCFELTQVMRQKDDKSFCDILNRMREGNHTGDDLSTIKQHCELQENNYGSEFLHIPHFYHTNSERNVHNQKVLLAKEGQSVCVKAIDICTQTTLPKKELQRIESNVKKLDTLHLTGNLEKELHLKVGLPYDMTTNVDTEDGLCNGTSLILRGLLYLDPCGNVPSVLLVEAEDGRIGRKARNRCRTFIPRNIQEEHPSWIPILSAHSQFMYLRKHPIKREQFPLTLAAGKTFNKSQGSSLTQAVMAFPEYKIEHLHYVGLSRVTKMSGVKILHGQFNEDKIHVNNNVKAEMSRLRSEAKLKLCFKPLAEIRSTCLIANFNAQSLHKHIEDVKSDWNMKNVMILGLCETRIKKGEDCSKYEIEDFEFHHIEQYLESNQRPHHGIAIYVKRTFSSTLMFSICTDEFECLARDILIPSTQSHIQVMMCYRKPGSANTILYNSLQEMMILANPCQPLVIMGDFNINKAAHRGVIAKMSQILRCRQIISDVTTKADTCIDLIFTNMNATEHGSIFTAVSHHHLTYASFGDVKVI